MNLVEPIENAIDGPVVNTFRSTRRNGVGPGVICAGQRSGGIADAQADEIQPSAAAHDGILGSYI